MSTQINCNNDVKNLGWLDCLSNLKHFKRLILVPTYDADGDLNEFATKSAVTKAAIQALINSETAGNRIFPMPIIKNVEFTSDDAKVATDDDDQSYFIRHGQMSCIGMIWGATEVFIYKLSSFNYASNYNVYAIDNAGNFIYLTDEATKLKVKPIPISDFYVMPVQATAEDVYKAKVSFKFDLKGDSRYLLRHINANDLDFDGLSTSDIYSLEDVTLTVGTPTTGGATITAKLTQEPDINVVGLAKEDFILKDDAGGAETITTLVDNGNGTYTATWTVGADGYVLTAKKDKYSFNTATFSVSGS